MSLINYDQAFDYRRCLCTITRAPYGNFALTHASCFNPPTTKHLAEHPALGTASVSLINYVGTVRSPAG